MRTCPRCDTRLNDSQTRCPACGADYLETVISSLGGPDTDVAMQLTALEEDLRPLDDAPAPAWTDTARRMKPLLGGGAALFGLVAGIATCANLFFLIAGAAGAFALFAKLRHRQPLSPGEAIVKAAARIFDEDATRLRGIHGETPEIEERLSAMQRYIDETLARQQEAHVRNARTILRYAIALLVAACIGVGALAIRNHAARKAAAAYAAQPEWVKLRDAYLASEADEFTGNAFRLKVLRAMLESGEQAAAEEFFFAHCQGSIGDFECALLIAGHYRNDSEALAAFVERVSLRYDSDTKKIKRLKP